MRGRFCLQRGRIGDEARATLTRRSRRTARPCRRRPTTPTIKSPCSTRCRRRHGHISRRRTSSSRRTSSRRRSASIARRATTIRATGWRVRRSRSSIARSAIGSRRRARSRRFKCCANAPAPPRPSRFSTRRRANRSTSASTTPACAMRLTSIGGMTGINFTFDRDIQDRPTSVQLDGVTLEQALNQIMTMNQLSYKILSERSIFVFPDTTPKHAQYDEQVIRTFYLSHADSTEVMQILSTIIRLPGIAVQPAIAGNKTANTITIRGTSSVVQILEKVIEQNDKPRAEIVVDVEILEVDRTRAKDYGLELTQYAVGGVLSPEVAPTGGSTGTGGGTGGGTTGGVDAAGRDVTAALQREHDFARPDDIGLLPGRAGRDRALHGVGFAHQDHRQAAAARRGRRQADAEARLADSDHLDQLYADCDRRRRRQSAQLVSIQGRRREHRHDADGDARRRHPPRRDCRRQFARVATSSSAASTFRPSASARSRRGCVCATANRTCWPGCSRKRTRTASPESRARSTSRFSRSCSRTTRCRASRSTWSCC